MQFDAWHYAALLALLPLLLALYGRAFRQKREALAAFFERARAPGLSPGLERRRHWRRALLVSAAGACLVLALMQPRWGTAVQDVPRQGRDLIVLLDVSLSMLAEDVAPNRLQRAKAAVRELVATIAAEGGHRLALVAFAGRASLRCPLTLDYRLFLERLDEAGVASVDQKGTRIGDALRQTLQSFGQLNYAYTDLILLSDGEDQGSLPLEAAGFAAAHHLSLHAVGVGDPAAAAAIPVDDGAGRRTYLTFREQEVRSRMQPDLLRQMAAATGGAYLPLAADAAGLERIYADHIEGRPQRQIDAATSEGPAHRYQWFVLLALLLLASDMLRREPGAGTA